MVFINFECYAQCDLGDIISTMPKTHVYMAGVKNMVPCTSNVHLVDSPSKMNYSVVRIDDVLIYVHVSFVPVDFIIMDMSYDVYVFMSKYFE